MRTYSYKINQIPRDTTVTLYVFSCTHFGAWGVDYELLKKDIERVAQDPWAIWIHLGDAIEAIKKDDKRWRQEALDPRYLCECPVDRQIDDVIYHFEPIKDKGLGFMIGNHEDTYVRDTQSNPARRIANGLGIEYLGHTALIKLVLISKNGFHWEPVVLAFHGSTGSTTIPGMVGYIIKKAEPFRDADVAVMGHVHKKLAINSSVDLGLDKKEMKLTEIDKRYLISGTYLKTYAIREDGNASYGEKRMYAPSSLGCGRVLFDVSNRTITCVDH